MSDRPFYNDRDQVVGTLSRCSDGQLRLRKHVDPKRHKLYAPPGWAIDEAHLGELEACGAAGVELHVTTGKVLRASLAAFRECGRIINRGHGRQVVLADRYWSGGTTEASSGRQLSLFGGIS